MTYAAKYDRCKMMGEDGEQSSQKTVGTDHLFTISYYLFFSFKQILERKI